MYVVCYKYHILPTHLLGAVAWGADGYIVDWVESIIFLVVHWPYEIGLCLEMLETKQHYKKYIKDEAKRKQTSLG